MNIIGSFHRFLDKQNWLAKSLFLAFLITLHDLELYIFPRTLEISATIRMVISPKLTACYRQGRSPFHYCMTPDFFKRNLLSSQDRVAHVRSPLELRLCDYAFQLKLSVPARKSALITVSNAKNSHSYPFTILNSRLCTEIRNMVQYVEETHREVSTIVLVGLGRSFLVAPQLSFLSKLCVAKATLSLDEFWGKDQTSRDPTLEERRDDYSSLFHSFIRLHACLTYENAESYVTSINAYRKSLLSTAPQSGKFAQDYREYVDMYTQQLLSPGVTTQYFSKSILLVGASGMSFGLGTALARTGDFRYGTPFSAWECPCEVRKWVSVPLTQRDRKQQMESQIAIGRKLKSQLSDMPLKELCRSLSRRVAYNDSESQPNPSPPGENATETVSEGSMLSANDLKECGELSEIFPVHRFQQKLARRAQEIASLGKAERQAIKRLSRACQKDM